MYVCLFFFLNYILKRNYTSFSVNIKNNLKGTWKAHFITIQYWLFFWLKKNLLFPIFILKQKKITQNNFHPSNKKNEKSV